MTYYVLHKDSYYLMNYLSPFVIMESIGIIFMFMRMRIGRKWLQNTVAFFAAFTFDVYVFHCHPLIFDKLIEGMFDGVAATGVFTMLLHWMMFCLTAYIVFSLCGLIREKTIRILKTDKVIIKVSEFTDGFLNEV